MIDSDGPKLPGRSLHQFIGPGQCDYVNARRIINGLDQAATIAGYARELEQIVADAADRAPVAPAPAIVPPAPTPAVVPVEPVQPVDVWWRVEESALRAMATEFGLPIG